VTLKTLKIPLIVAVALFIQACESLRDCYPNCPSDEQVLTQAGARQLTAEEVRAHVTGKTEDWLHGGAYYHPDGRIEARWLRVRYEGTWEITADGELCYELPKWQRRCQIYMERDGEIHLLDEGRDIGVRAIYPGKKLHTIEILKPVGK
jgi:hypothetical protein